MKNQKEAKHLGVIVCSFAVLIVMGLSCKKNGEDKLSDTKVPTESKLTKAEEILIMKAGFSTNDAEKTGNSFLVEGDIMMSKEDLTRQKELRKGLAVTNGPSTEQYKSGYTLAAKYINNGQIKIKVNGGNLQQLVTDATVIAIKRYNDLKLKTTFVLETNPTATADITVSMKDLGGRDANGGITLGQASGFPTADGTPSPGFALNNQYYTSAFTPTQIAAVIAHEVGHCIGFRHTDYINRRSCGIGSQGEPTVDYLTNEEETEYLLDANGNRIPDLTLTASLIPGTPKTDSSSWMRACNAPGAFTTNDKTAIYYLLGRQ